MPKKYTVVIIDDEALGRQVIKTYLADFPDFEIKAECGDGFEGLKAIQEFKPDIVFLDIQMPKINGFEMLEVLDNPPAIVFSTAYEEYALKAFEASAADYLLKPYSKARFAEALNRALLFVKERGAQKQVLSALVQHRQQQIETLERIVVKAGSSILIIPTGTVLYLEAQDDYVMLHTKDGKFLKQQTMKFFEQHLDTREFVRIHRSYIVRVSMIKEIQPLSKDAHRVLLKNGQTLPVSRRGLTKLKQLLN